MKERARTDNVKEEKEAVRRKYKMKRHQRVRRDQRQNNKQLLFTAFTLWIIIIKKRKGKKMYTTDLHKNVLKINRSSSQDP